MKESLRQCTSWLHTWTGLVVGWILFFVFVTGTPGYFQHEITRWMQPERPMEKTTEPADSAVLIDLAIKRLNEVAPVAAAWNINLPHEALAPRGQQPFTIRWEQMPDAGHDHGISVTERLDPITGAVIPQGPEPRATAGGNGLYRMHYVLHYIPVDWAIKIVGICTMLMLIAIVTGVITHKKIFKDFFTFRPGKGQRSWLDAHNAISVMALPFFLMITYSGLVFFLFTYMPAGRDVVYGSGPQARQAYIKELREQDDHRHAPISRPAIAIAPLVQQAEADWGRGQVQAITIEAHEGEPPEIVIQRTRGGSVDFFNPEKRVYDARTGASLEPEPTPGGGTVKTQSFLLNLHEGLFADIWGRWLYFVAGLLGCAMIGTGLVLWAVKRRKFHLGSGLEGREHFGVRLVEILNVASIAGLPLAVAAYFWANRLLPIDLADRPAWEFHSLFAVWLATLFYSLARPLHRAWIELLWGSCLAFALVPIVNLLTSDKHLFNTLAYGDWVLAGFDLTMWAMAAIFAIMAVKVSRRLRPVTAPAPRPVASRPTLDRSAA